MEKGESVRKRGASHGAFLIAGTENGNPINMGIKVG
jgi:hypothetical protein